MGPVLFKGSGYVRAEASYREDFSSITKSLAGPLCFDKVSVKLALEWGNVLPVGEQGLIVNEQIFKDNKHLSSDEVLGELRKLGRSQIIVLPYTKQFFHVDLAVTVVNNFVIVPHVTQLVESQFSQKEKEVVAGTKRYLDTCAQKLVDQGLPVLRIPFYPGELIEYGYKRHTPDTSADEPKTPTSSISPVNIVQVRDNEGNLTVLVPIPNYKCRFMDVDTKERERYLSHARALKDEISRVYRNAGATRVEFTEYGANNLQGLNHCRTAQIPYFASSESWFHSLRSLQ